MDFKEFISRYIWITAFFGWAGLLIILSMIPSKSLPDIGDNESSFRLDYFIHFGVFGVYSMLYGLWRLEWITEHKKRELFIFLATGSIYAISTELLQYFVEGRTVNPVDLLLNLAGLYLGMTIFYLIFAKKSTADG